jgi:hypothetical protein
MASRPSILTSSTNTRSRAFRVVKSLLPVKEAGEVGLNLLDADVRPWVVSRFFLSGRDQVACRPPSSPRRSVHDGGHDDWSDLLVFPLGLRPRFPGTA